ncbi:MAG: hypothetical protein ACTS85_03895 [Arsenophonus sp. NC-PG7-MAG3]
MEKNNIKAEEATDREVFSEKVLNMEGFQDRKIEKTGMKWSEDRKKKHSEQMKDYWKKRKEQRIKK